MPHNLQKQILQVMHWIIQLAVTIRFVCVKSCSCIIMSFMISPESIKSALIPVKYHIALLPFFFLISIILLIRS